MPSTLSEWIKGRNAQAREREDRETAHTICCDLNNGGGVWLDHEGQRTRLIIRPASDRSVAALEQMTRVALILPMEQGRDDITPR